MCKLTGKIDEVLVNQFMTSEEFQLI